MRTEPNIYVCSTVRHLLFALLRAASQEYDYGLELGSIAKIWRGGCIIRARFLNDITAAYRRDPELTNLLLDPYFREAILSRQGALRRTIQVAVELGIPCLAMSASIFAVSRSKNAATSLWTLREGSSTSISRRTEKGTSVVRTLACSPAPIPRSMRTSSEMNASDFIK